MTIENDLRDLLNRHSAEKPSNTPDFMLARFLIRCLHLWNDTTQDREKWYGALAPGARLGWHLESVDSLELTIRSSKCLLSANIRFVGQLVQCKEMDLLRIRNFGRTSLSEVKYVLASKGLQLASHTNTVERAAFREMAR